MRPLVWHLVDSNQSTRYFCAIAAHSDRGRFRLAIGSLAPSGPLQESMVERGAGTFALGASAKSRYPLATLRLASLLRREGVQLLHAHCFYPTLIGILAARLAGCRFVFTRHHSDHNLRLGKRWHTRLDALCARHADRVIAVSQATAEIMVRAEGVPASQITVVHNGQDPLADPDPDAVRALRDEIGVAPEDRPCLMLGRLHEEKGHFVLIEALPSVLSRHPRALVLVVGEGPHRAWMEEAVARNRLSGRVRFLGVRRDVPALMVVAEVVVVPSLAESFGFVALEAMALGRAVVAASTGGLPEIVVPGESGMLVAKGDARQLADGICRVLEDPALARRLGEAGRERARRFPALAMVRGYEAVHAETLSV
jgi:glycosyltransferase involved in cell wall biosynthesis